MQTYCDIPGTLYEADTDEGVAETAAVNNKPFGLNAALNSFRSVTKFS